MSVVDTTYSLKLKQVHEPNQIIVKEDEEIEQLLKKYDVIHEIENDNGEDIVEKYETYFDKLNEVVLNKRNEIAEIEKAINGVGKIQMFNTKKKNNANKLIDCVNRITQRIKDCKIAIFKKEMKELNKSHQKRYRVDNDYLIDKENLMIKNSLNKLGLWSKKTKYSILFDSSKNGDGSNNTLYDEVFGKSNLYFISIDECSNIYGGYLSSRITKGDDYIEDENSFIFSLYRIGKPTMLHYSIDPDKSSFAFKLYNSINKHLLFSFGMDIFANKIGINKSYCDNYYYSKSKKQNDLVVDYFPYYFSIKRILVIQMH